jgi:hypothetical protein
LLAGQGNSKGVISDVKTRFLLGFVGIMLVVAIELGLRGNAGAPEQHGQARQAAETTATPANLAPATSDPLVPPIALAGSSESDPSVSPAGIAVAEAWAADFAHSRRAVFEPHGGQVCASGCAASRHPTDELTRSDFRRLLEEFAGQPMDETSLAFETLLYYGRQTSKLLAAQGSPGSPPLDPLRAAVLRRELQSTHATIEVRVVDEQGEVRSWLPPTHVPLDRRHVFPMETKRLQPLVTSGTVKRVGLHHLWTRL